MMAIVPPTDSVPTWLNQADQASEWHRDGQASFIAMYCICGKWHYHDRPSDVGAGPVRSRAMTEATPSAESAFEEWWNRNDVPPGHTADMVPREVPYAAFMSAWQNRAAHVAPLMEALERAAKEHHEQALHKFGGTKRIDFEECDRELCAVARAAWLAAQEAAP